jgi:hypothetical protein
VVRRISIVKIAKSKEKSNSIHEVQEEERKKGKKKKKEKRLRLKARSQQSSYFALIYTQINTMQSIAQVQNVQKINAVSTGKVVNEKSMMVWRPHGNK